jgi:hypothetical protein
MVQISFSTLHTPRWSCSSKTCPDSSFCLGHLTHRTLGLETFGYMARMERGHCSVTVFRFPSLLITQQMFSSCRVPCVNGSTRPGPLIIPSYLKTSSYVLLTVWEVTRQFHGELISIRYAYIKMNVSFSKLQEHLPCCSPVFIWNGHTQSPLIMSIHAHSRSLMQTTWHWSHSLRSWRTANREVV